jgi:hypothetical protein
MDTDVHYDPYIFVLAWECLSEICLEELTRHYTEQAYQTFYPELFGITPY